MTFKNCINKNITICIVKQTKKQLKRGKKLSDMKIIILINAIKTTWHHLCKIDDQRNQKSIRKIKAIEKQIQKGD